MSWTGSAWAKETMGHGSYAQKLVLMMLGEYHNTESNIAYPSIKELARVCEMPERTVRWCLKNLEDMGFITTKQKGNQYQRTEYVLLFAAAQSYAPAKDGAAMVAATQSYAPAKDGAAMVAATQSYAPAIAATQSYAPAKDGAAMVAGASEAAKDGIVHRQRVVSGPAIPVHTNLQEPAVEPLRESEYIQALTVLETLPGYRFEELRANQLVAYLTRMKITPERAEEIAIAIQAKVSYEKGKWSYSTLAGKQWTSDLYGLLKSWVRRPPLVSQNGGSNGKSQSNPTPYQDRPHKIYRVPEGPVQLGR